MKWTQAWYDGGQNDSQTVAINGLGDRVECTEVGGLDAFKRRDVAAVDILVEVRRKQAPIAAPVIDSGMYLLCFSLAQREVRSTLTAVAADRKSTRLNSSHLE